MARSLPSGWVGVWRRMARQISPLGGRPHVCLPRRCQVCRSDVPPIVCPASACPPPTSACLAPIDLSRDGRARGGRILADKLLAPLPRLFPLSCCHGAAHFCAAAARSRVPRGDGVDVYPWRLAAAAPGYDGARPAARAHGRSRRGLSPYLIIVGSGGRGVARRGRRQPLHPPRGSGPPPRGGGWHPPRPAVVTQLHAAAAGRVRHRGWGGCRGR